MLSTDRLEGFTAPKGMNLPYCYDGEGASRATNNSRCDGRIVRNYAPLVVPHLYEKDSSSTGYGARFADFFLLAIESQSTRRLSGPSIGSFELRALIGSALAHEASNKTDAASQLLMRFVEQKFAQREVADVDSMLCAFGQTISKWSDLSLVAVVCSTYRLRTKLSVWGKIRDVVSKELDSRGLKSKEVLAGLLDDN